MTGGGHSSSKDDLALGTGASTNRPADSFDALLEAAVSPSEGSEAAGTQSGRFERLALGTRVSDQFVVEWYAGAGGMGDVYRCQDVERATSVALKVIRNVGDQARFRREVLILAAVSHDAIVRYVAHGNTESGTPYLAMEWLEGEDLGKRLKRSRPSVHDTIKLVRRICEALSHAHGNGFIHRDLKPSNVFLCAGRVEDAKLLDFGVAHRGVATQTATRAGTLLGTVGYMAPEQASGIRLPDARDDLFSLGCVMFECLTGRPAFLGDSSVAVLESVLHVDPPAAHTLQPDVPVELSLLVQRLLSKHRRDRPASVAVVLEELDAFADANSDASVRALLTASTAWRAVPSRFSARVFAALPKVAAGYPASVEAVARRFGASILASHEGTLLLELEDRALVDLAESTVQCGLALLEQEPSLQLSVSISSEMPPLGASGSIATNAVTLALYRCRAETETQQLPDCVREAGRHRLALPFVGRDAELATLDAVFEECANDEVARSLLASAPSGLGKSRLAAEFISRVAADGRTRVLAVRADPIAGDVPWSLARALAGVSSQQTVDDAKRVLRDHYERSTASSPLIIYIDDAHCADLVSMQFVASLLSSMPERSVLVMGLMRPEPNPELHAVWQSTGAHTLHLRPLSIRACERYLRATLPSAQQADASVVQAVDLTEGSPRLLTALVLAVLQHGSGGFDAAAMLFEERLSQLASAELSVLCAASVFGSLFFPSGLSAILDSGGGGGGGERELAALRERKFISERPHSLFVQEPAYAISHPIIAEAAWRILRESDRVQARRRASEWLSRLQRASGELLEPTFLR